MYTPRLNREDDPTTLRQFIRENPLCALVTLADTGLVASHIPVVLHERETGFGLLRGHLARANPQWKQFSAELQALAIFTGPQHFISASWYPGKKTHGEEVPTWNYTAVHAYGDLRVIEDPDWLLEHLKSLTNQSEVIAEVPWKVTDAPAKFISVEMRNIVGIELDVTRVEGKWKVSQNRNDEDAAAVVAGLRGLKTPAGEAMGELVQQRRPHSQAAQPARHAGPGLSRT
jgi:transcriptional regulator